MAKSPRPIQIQPPLLGVDQTLVIGVSGGPDSLCLLDLLRREQPSSPIAAYFDHQLRPESEAEAGHVCAIAGKMGVRFVTGSADVRAYAAENKLSIEEAARKLRYRFLFDQARQYHALGVAVAHTADDQVETVLMNFLRGAGLNGLRGMQPFTLLPEFDAELPLFRPILHLWRAETEAYCREHELTPVYDPTNQDQTYLRNRIRHSLIPELEKYNPRFMEAVFRMAQTAADDHAALEESVDVAWPGAVAEIGRGYIAFHLPVLQEASLGLRRNLFRRAAQSLRSDLRDLDFEVWQRAAHFVRAPDDLLAELAPKQADLASGMYIFSEGEKIYLANRQADFPHSHWPQVAGVWMCPRNAALSMTGGWQLTVDEMEDRTAFARAQENADPFQAWLDADLMAEALSVRARRAGDRFQPLGMETGSIKLSDFFINVKLPKRARPRWPLVCAGDEIAWVAGYRIAHQFRVTEKTRRVLHLEVKRLPSD